MTDLAPRGPSSLGTLDAARHALEMAETVGEVAAIIDKAEALRRAARNVTLGLGAQNDWAAFKIDAQRKAGWLLPQQIQRGGDPKSHAVTLEDLGVSAKQSSRWQELAAIPDEVVEEYKARKLEAEDEITTRGLLGFAEADGLGGTAARLVESNENEWYTPAHYIEAARLVLGDIDLDPATSHAANEVVKAAQIFTAEDDSLAQVWHGRVWLNPPYGRLAGEFITKLVWDHQTDNVKAAVALVNAHCTDTAWFQQLWDYPLCFTDHRIDFDSAGRDKRTTSTHGSVFAYLGPDREVFAGAFAQFGAVVRRWP